MQPVTVDLGSFEMDLDPRFVPHTSSFVGPVEREEGVRLALVSRAPKPFQPNLVTTYSEDLVAPEELQSYLEGEMAKLSETEGFEQIDREPVVLDDGRPAFLQRHSFDMDGYRVEQLQMYTATCGLILIVTATHLAGEPFSTYADVFRGMLMSAKPI